MNTLLRGSVAVIAMMTMGGIAQAQTHSILNPASEQVTTTTTSTSAVTKSWANQNQNNFTACPNANANCWTGTKNVTTTSTVVETAFTTTGSAPDDTEAATRTVTNSFTLTGSVNKDCSFYAGNNAAGRTIDFGVIGVKTGNNENVNAAFEMAGPLSANINTLTAGCNFNNEVVITKRDGSDYSGMNLVGNPGGFDVTQFQSNIPYEVTATWQGVGLNDVTQGSPQSLTVTTGQATATKQQGAWRSAMNIAINAPALTNRGLVAGTYQDTLTIRLSAL